jgi:hypothetical protein
VGFINVIRNGAQLAPANYTATNGTTVVLANACTAGDIVVIEVFTLTSISNALPLTGGTVTGASTFNVGVNLAVSSGNVGIGTSSPSSPLNVVSASSSLAIAINGRSSDNLGAMYFYANNGSTQHATITASATEFRLSSVPAAAVQTFYTNGSERARIDSSGNLLVGNSSQVWDERILGFRTTSAVVGGFYSSSASYTSSVIRAQTETAAGTGWYFFEGRAAGGSFQYGIRGNGTVTTSDERRKKNVEPARSYLADVCNIPVVKYNWKTDEDDAPKELGWLAQDVQKVFPNMVVTHHDGPNDDQEVLLLKKEVFLPMLMKCIQEQQAMIEELKSKVAALEAQ